MLAASIYESKLALGALRLRISFTSAFRNAVVLFLRALQPQGLELVAIRPEMSTGAPAGVAVTIPFPSATRVRPVADLQLAIGTRATGRNVQAANHAVSVNTHTIGSWLDRNIVVNISSAVSVVVALDTERLGGFVADRHAWLWIRSTCALTDTVLAR